MNERAIRKLDDSQVESFDTEYVQGSRWHLITGCIDRDFSGGDFSFLDVGGGNGRFADRLLEHYPRAVGAVLDNSEYLLARNEPNERKTLILQSAGSLGLTDTKYDVICVHWLLHHLVGDTYRRTRDNQLGILSELRELLTPGGRISIFENIYTGWLIPNLPGWLIYQLTSLKPLAPVTRRMGANTAGVGVCFQNKGSWLETIAEAGLEVASYIEPDNDWTWPLRPSWRAALHLKNIKVGHFWAKRR